MTTTSQSSEPVDSIQSRLLPIAPWLRPRRRASTYSANPAAASSTTIPASFDLVLIGPAAPAVAVSVTSPAPAEGLTTAALQATAARRSGRRLDGTTSHIDSASEAKSKARLTWSAEFPPDRDCSPGPPPLKGVGVGLGADRTVPVVDVETVLAAVVVEVESLSVDEDVAIVPVEDVSLTVVEVVPVDAVVSVDEDVSLTVVEVVSVDEVV